MACVFAHLFYSNLNRIRVDQACLRVLSNARCQGKARDLRGYRSPVRPKMLGRARFLFAGGAVAWRVRLDFEVCCEIAFTFFD